MSEALNVIPAPALSPDDDLRLLSVLEASNLTGLSRETINSHMDAYRDSGHRVGLAYVQPGSRRLVTRAIIRDWYNKMMLNAR